MDAWQLMPSGIGPVDRELGGLPQRSIAIWWGQAGGGKTCAALAFLRAGILCGETVAMLTTHTSDALQAQAQALCGLDLQRHQRAGQLLLLDVTELGKLITSDPHQTLSALRHRLLSECARRALSRLVFDPLDPLVANTRPDAAAQLAGEFEALFGQLGTTTLCTAYRGLGEHPVLEALGQRAPATFDGTAEAIYVRNASWSTLAGKSLSLTRGKECFPKSLFADPPRRRLTSENKPTMREISSDALRRRVEEQRATRPFPRVERSELPAQEPQEQSMGRESWIEEAPPLPTEDIPGTWDEDTLASTSVRRGPTGEAALQGEEPPDETTAGGGVPAAALDASPTAVATSLLDDELAGAGALEQVASEEDTEAVWPGPRQLESRRDATPAPLPALLTPVAPSPAQTAPLATDVATTAGMDLEQILASEGGGLEGAATTVDTPLIFSASFDEDATTNVETPPGVNVETPPGLEDEDEVASR